MTSLRPTSRLPHDPLRWRCETQRARQSCLFGARVPVYIYGDEVVTHTGTLRRRTIIIEDKALAQVQRAVFHSLWNDARGPLSVDLRPWGTRAIKMAGQR